MRHDSQRDDPSTPRYSSSVLRTLSHTLPAPIAHQLRDFAFEHRLSESVILEHSLRRFLESDSAEHLAEQLRSAGCGLRRKTA